MYKKIYFEVSKMVIFGFKSQLKIMHAIELHMSADQYIGLRSVFFDAVKSS